MGEQIKVAYTGLDGFTSKAYVDDETLIGTDKHTDEPVELEVRYFEVAPEPLDCACEDREAIVRHEGVFCGTCGALIARHEPSDRGSDA